MLMVPFQRTRALLISLSLRLFFMLKGENIKLLLNSLPLLGKTLLQLASSRFLRLGSASVIVLHLNNKTNQNTLVTFLLNSM